MNIGFIPIDNRPVCCTLAQDIAAIDSSIKFYIPPREFLGGLKKNADYEAIFSWLKNLPALEALVVSLDSIAYGGLIPSRRCPESFEEIKTRILKFKEILAPQNAKIYAFSSIMRISNNNVNEEEKEYWSRWGKRIFDYSYQTHKLGCESCISNGIPSEILDDYLNIRKRNFEINKLYLEWQKEGFFDTLIFSKDDCAEYGFNVQEARALETLGGFTKTGADEIPLTLLARAIRAEKTLKIAPIFTEPDCKDLISNYEDVSIENSVKGQLELAGCEITTPEQADILLYINNFRERQGEIVMKIPTEAFNGKWQTPQKPYMIADVRFANGADNAFVKQVLTKPADKNFFGYAAWNTSANTLGSLICAAKVKFFAQEYNHEAFLKLQMTRLLDDWAYQANCRQNLSSPDPKALSEMILPYKKQAENFLQKDFETSYKFPWNRLFEVEIEFN
ncbi:TPA: DUF4127 family protein [Candidatus Scatenecus faecavium]|uniref:DUF4127 family protein n=1 Tax=Candidatus Scatenecus faecavium TaxID=2840915 RepID=A0A9D1K2Z0_9BACT|nr:DUF4127 family protein [Candidatus Scatenecus faecavium]